MLLLDCFTEDEVQDPAYRKSIEDYIEYLRACRSPQADYWQARLDAKDEEAAQLLKHLPEKQAKMNRPLEEQMRDPEQHPLWKGLADAYRKMGYHWYALHTEALIEGDVELSDHILERQDIKKRTAPLQSAKVFQFPFDGSRN